MTLKQVQSYTKDCDQVWFVYDTTSLDTLNQIENAYLPHASHNVPQGCPMFLVGNKIDMGSVITEVSFELV